MNILEKNTILDYGKYQLKVVELYPTQTKLTRSDGSELVMDNKLIFAELRQGLFKIRG